MKNVFPALGYSLDSLTGTSLRGYVTTSYKELVKLLGDPVNVYNDGKTDAEWVVVTPAGVASIYNYKDGKNYCGEDGTPTEDITEWHIGGASKDVVSFITSAFNN